MVKYSEGKKVVRHLYLDTLAHTINLNIVVDHVHPFMTTVFPNSLFQHDHVPCHTAELVQEWFREHDKEFKVNFQIPQI